MTDLPTATGVGANPKPHKPMVLLWLDSADRFAAAVQNSNFSDFVELALYRAHDLPPDEKLERADAVVCWNLPPGVVSKMKRLQWIQCQSVGVEKWLARPDLPPNLTLTGTRGVHRLQMPDTIFGSLFQVTKPFNLLRQQQQRRIWNRVSPPSLAGKTLGIVGLGAIGAELARKACALDMRVIGVKRTMEAVTGVERIYALDDLDSVLAQSDYVVMLIPVTRHTKDIMDAARFARMKPSAWLLNFARGELIVDNDLVAAVDKGIIAGAVLDVFRQEPLPANHLFWATKNIILYPHIGGMHPERENFVVALFMENLERFLQGSPLKSLVDRNRGY